MKAKVPVMRSQAWVDERIMYLDMLALLVLHEVFGFGEKRLKVYYRAIDEMDAYYRRYTDPKSDPDWGKKDRLGYGKTVLWAMKRDLYELGFDYDEMVAEIVKEKSKSLEGQNNDENLKKG